MTYDTSRRIIAFAVIIALIGAGILVGPQLTGLITMGNVIEYADSIGLNFDSTTSFEWKPKHPGKIRSIRVSGIIIGNGTVELSVEENKNVLVVFDNKEKKGLEDITGFVVGGEGIEENVTAENIIDVNETMQAIQEEINKSNETLGPVVEPETENIEQLNKTNETAVGQLNESHAALEKEISLKLQYNKGTKWDSDDNGIEEERGVVDLTVEDSVFSWNADETKLCTFWKIYSMDKGKITTRCFGSEECCNFAGLSPTAGRRWNDAYFSFLGYDDAGYSNEVSAKVVYYDVDIDKMNSEIAQTDFATLPVRFAKKETTQFLFNLECKETCRVMLNETSYRFYVRLSNAELFLNNITYEIEEEQTDVMSKIKESEKVRKDVIDLVEKENRARVIVRYKEKSTKRLAKEFGRTQAGVLTSVELADILDDDNVEGVYLDNPVSLLTEQSLGIIRQPEVLNLSINGSGVKICTVDTGVDSNVVNYNNGHDFVNNDNDSADDHGHGTEVAYILRQTAPEAELIVAKVMDSNGIGYESDVLAGLEYCIEENADIITFSIGAGSYAGYCDDNVVANVSVEAVNKGIIVIAATGNDGSTGIKSPACGSKVLRVAASNKDDGITSFTNINYWTDVLAPGEGIQVKTLNNNIVTGSGTSMSAPFVAGSAALTLSEEPLMQPTEMRYRLRSTGKTVEYQYNGSLRINISRIDIYNAIYNNITNEPYIYDVRDVESGNESNFTIADSSITVTEAIEPNATYVTIPTYQTNVTVYGHINTSTGNLTNCSISIYLNNSLIDIIDTNVWTDWYNYSWHYRKKINIHSLVSSSFTNATIAVNFSTSNLVAQGLLNSDCSNIRFFDATGKELAHDIEGSTCGSTDTTYWVLANLTGNVNNTIYAYYNFSGSALQKDPQKTDLGLILWLHLDNSSQYEESDTNALDFSGYKNNVTISGAVLNNTGRFGRSFKFDGINDKMNPAGDTIMSCINKEMTYSAWIKTNNSAGVIIERGGATYGVQLVVNNGKAEFSYRWNSNPSIKTITGPYVNDSSWHFIVGTANSSNNITLYVDGVPVNVTGITLLGTEPTDGESIGSVSDIGASTSAVSVSDYYYGLIDELRIYNRSLRADEVLLLYNSTVLYVDNQTVMSTDSNGNYNYTFQAPLRAGTYNVTVNTTYNGAVGSSADILNISYWLLISEELTPNPVFKTQNVSVSGTVTNISGQAIPNVTVWVYFNNNLVSPVYTNYSGSYATSDKFIALDLVSGYANSGGNAYPWNYGTGQRAAYIGNFDDGSGKAYRVYTMYNTSSLADNATVTSAKIHSYLIANSVEEGDGDAHIRACDYGDTLDDNEYSATSMGRDHGIIFEDTSLVDNWYNLALGNLSEEIKKTDVSRFCFSASFGLADEDDRWGTVSYLANNYPVYITVNYTIPAGWWNGSFMKCMNITVENPSADYLAGYYNNETDVLRGRPLNITVTYDADMKTDFSDLRFVRAPCGFDGTLLDSELDTFTTATSADFWVETQSIPPGGTVMSVYYDNSEAALLNTSGIKNISYSINASFGDEEIQYIPTLSDVDGNYNFTFTPPSVNGTYIVIVNATYGIYIGSTSQTLNISTIPILVSETLFPNKTTSGSSVIVYGHINTSIGTNVTNTTIYIYLNGTLINVTSTNVWADWWNYNWSYRTMVDLELKTSTNQNNIIALVNLSTAQYITAGLMESDCGDVRFADTNRRELPYTIDPLTCNSTNTTFWVWVNLTSNSNTTIYAYYGNPSATLKTDYANPDSNLVLYLHFDNSSTYGENSNRVFDFSGYGNNATLGAGNEFINKTGGRFGGTLQVDGTGDYARIPDSTSLDIINGITITAWIKVRTAANYATIIGKRDPSAKEGNFAFRTGSAASVDELQFYWSVSGAWQVYATTDADLTTGTWYFVAASYNNSEMRILRNGVNLTKSCAAGTCSGNLESDNNNVSIGRPGEYAGEYFNGQIDEVRIYNRSLSVDEVLGIYNSTKPYFLENETLTKTDSSGDYNFTFTAPATNGVYNITVNLTYDEVVGSNSKLLLIGLECVDDLWCSDGSQCISNYCFLTQGRLIIQNSTPENITVIDKTGRMAIRGTLTESCSKNPTDGNYFYIRDSSDNPVAWINSTNGNMCIDGSLSENQGTISSDGDDFIVQNETGTAVMYIDGATGDMYLNRNLVQNANIP
ncbi:DUF2341 domain-containing protein [Candidatus Woesearchaeota archaeon]|nr:DUF2341 domain-containing protein [Candidatus Woesearchaeota archaeon]